MRPGPWFLLLLLFAPAVAWAGPAAMFANIQGEEVAFRVTGEAMTWP